MDLLTSTAQAECYKLLSECFYEPREALFGPDGMIVSLAGNLELAGFPAAAENARTMLHTRESIEKLRVEFARLFVGPFSLEAPPYGSCYLEPGNQVMGETTVAVRGTYETCGLSVSEEIKEPPDHIAIELEFLHYLICKAADAQRGNNEAQCMEWSRKVGEFEERLFLGFAKAFCRKVLEATESPFYRALAECMLHFAARVPDLPTIGVR